MRQPCLTAEQEKRLLAMSTVYRQQLDLLQQNRSQAPSREHQPPLYPPILRGKENKRVEFETKVNNIQIDSISFIEHYSFEAFNEGIGHRISGGTYRRGS